MGSTPMPTKFEKSYWDHALYPTNLVYTMIDPRFLNDYRLRLESDSPTLFTGAEDIEDNGRAEHMDVEIRDFDIDSGGHTLSL
jgi:hypothetical protein